MKKILIIIVTALMLVCCDSSIKVTHAQFEISRIEYSKDNTGRGFRATYFIYNGHQWISFGDDWNCIIHDPDCPCHSGQTVELSDDISVSVTDENEY